MTGSISRRTMPSVLALVIAFGICGTSAQQKEFVEAQRANTTALHDYTWKSRTELKLKAHRRGDSASVARVIQALNLRGLMQLRRASSNTPTAWLERPRMGLKPGTW